MIYYYSNVGFVGEKLGNDDVRVYENVELGGIVWKYIYKVICCKF